jgi:hypothetical protein
VNLERLRRFLEIRKSTGAITVPQASAEGFDGKMGDWVTPKSRRTKNRTVSAPRERIDYRRRREEKFRLATTHANPSS